MKVQLRDVQSDVSGFTELASLANSLQGVSLKDVDLDMSLVTWFDANMCSPLGSILYRASRELNSIRLINIRPNVEKVFAENEFLSNYGHSPVPDEYETAIPYKRFEIKDERFFASYIVQHMIEKGIPEMTPGLEKKFQESIFEIFSNAVIHSETKHGIFSCGQFFPNDHRLDLSITDLGIGIRQKVLNGTNQDLSAEKAIKWALTEGNTTKKGLIPGGLGLKLLCEFAGLNGGRIQIVSDRGFWETSGGKETLELLPHSFPGTVVNVEINTADKKLYCLTSELKPDDIF